MPEMTASPPVKREPCVHDSSRTDGTLDWYCLKCGMDGYWHDGHRHDETHPSGKQLFRVTCPLSDGSGRTDG